MAVPERRERKTAAITIRTYESHLREYRATVLALAAQTGLNVEEVNTFVLMELQPRVFGPRVADRIARWQTGRPQPEDESSEDGTQNAPRRPDQA